MGLLERYKKTGGFVQLLSLLETCGPAKRDKFLTMIREENTAWENALRQRILSLDKILTWPNEALAEIVSRVQLLTLAGVYMSLEPSKQELIFSVCPFGQQKKLKDLLSEKNFTPGEMNSSVEKFLIDTRGLIQQNVLKMDKIDPSMEIVSDIEEKLNVYTIITPNKDQFIYQSEDDTPAGAPPTTSSTSSLSSSSGSSTQSSNLNSNSNFKMDPRNANFKIEKIDSSINNEEINQLKKKLHLLNTENNELKNEVHILKDKLEKIRRIA